MKSREAEKNKKKTLTSETLYGAIFFLVSLAFKTDIMTFLPVTQVNLYQCPCHANEGLERCTSIDEIFIPLHLPLLE